MTAAAGVDPTAQTVPDASADLRNFVANGPGPDQVRQRMRNARTAQAQDAQQRRLAELEQKRQRAELSYQEQREAKALREQRGKVAATKGLVEHLPNPAQNAVERVSNLPTPGGLFVLFMVLLGLVFLTVPVNGGYTRMQLFWFTLLGRTSLPETATSAAPSSSSGSSGGSDATGGPHINVSTSSGNPPALAAYTPALPTGLPGGTVLTKA